MFYKGVSSFEDESQNSRIHQSTQQSQTGTENNREENCEVRNTGVVLYLSSIIWLSERAKGLPGNWNSKKGFSWAAEKRDSRQHCGTNFYENGSVEIRRKSHPANVKGILIQNKRSDFKASVNKSIEMRCCKLLRWRANARKVSFETLYGGQCTLLTQLR